MKKKRIKNRPGYKICPDCNVEYLRNNENYIIMKTTGRASGKCRKCHYIYVSNRRRTVGTSSICHTCKSHYLSPSDYKYKGTTKFCSQLCSRRFRTRDDAALLAMRGLEDLNEYHIF